MKLRQFIFSLGCAVAFGGVMAGCDREPASNTPPQSSAPPAGAVELPVTAGPATQPTTAPAGSSMLLDGEPVAFPPARLMLRNRNDQVAAALFSVDPPNAIDDNYSGNSFYFEMPLEISDSRALAAATWNYKAPDSDRRDTIAGIFLQGRRQHLQPFDVRVEFEGSGPTMMVSLRGTFLQFDTRDDMLPPKMVAVQSRMLADVKLRPNRD